MAESKDNIVMKNMSGAIGKQLVFRRVNGKTIACKYPEPQSSGLYRRTNSVSYIICKSFGLCQQHYKGSGKESVL